MSKDGGPAFPTISETEQRVLGALEQGGEEYCYNFHYLMTETELDRKVVRCACRSLARKGLTYFQRGLWDDEGPAGSGYGATQQGLAMLAARGEGG